MGICVTLFFSLPSLYATNCGACLEHSLHASVSASGAFAMLEEFNSGQRIKIFKRYLSKSELCGAPPTPSQ